MVSFADIQHAYNKLYAEMRKYFWDFPTVQALADLEVEVYKTCQDLYQLRVRFQVLKSMIGSLVYEDDELNRRLNALDTLIHEDNTYVKLNRVREVIQK